MRGKVNITISLTDKYASERALAQLARVVDSDKLAIDIPLVRAYGAHVVVVHN